MALNSRIDLTQVFCDIDDFYKTFEKYCQTIPQITSSVGEKLCRSRLSLSKVMTIVIAFHGSGYRTFKEFYTLQVLPHWKKAFSKLVSYNRFVELMPWSMMLLCCFLQTRTGEMTGISFIDSTPIEVCHHPSVLLLENNLILGCLLTALRARQKAGGRRQEGRFLVNSFLIFDNFITP